MSETPTVLLVDDNDKLRELYRMSLEVLGHMRIVGEAADGAAGLDAAAKLRPDIVLLDLSMPTMDGLEALSRMRDASPGSRVVVLTGFRRDKLQDVAMALGASAFLEKGLTPTKLIEEVRAVADAPPPAHVSLSDDAREEMMRRIRELI